MLAWRSRQWQDKFGITAEQYFALLAYQGNACAGCRRPADPYDYALSVDHDHGCCPYPEGKSALFLRACGKCVRGLLCRPCNLHDVLAGRDAVDWVAIMAAADTMEVMLTLHDAIDEGILPWTLGAAQKRIQRRVGKIPTARGKRGNADLYSRSDLEAWAGARV